LIEDPRGSSKEILEYSSVTQAVEGQGNAFEAENEELLGG
jgi:hypothetical protein